MRNLQFKINGEYITKQADDLLKQGNMKSAMRILHGFTLSDQLSEQEHRALLYDILDGRARIKGTYPNDDYGIVYPEENKDKSNITDILLNLSEENEQLKEELEQQNNRIAYIFAHMQEKHSFDLDQMCTQYRQEYDETLFKDYEPEDTSTMFSDMLESYMERFRQDTEDDYGWLEPNGTFHPVEWGKHNAWAENWIREHYNEEKELELYYNDDQMLIPATDVMIYKLNWILIHNPSQGIGEHTSKPGYPISKAAKKFLYDYYETRKQYKKAKQIYESE